MNCKPGDIARVVIARFFPENLQKLVHVDGPPNERERRVFIASGFNPNEWWKCTVWQAIRTGSEVVGETYLIPPGGTCLFRDAHLRPLPGPEEVQAYDRERELELQ